MRTFTAAPETACAGGGAEFDYARLHEISPHDYTLYIAARGIYTNAGGLTTRDLADAEVVDAAALRMIVNALLIARYGCAVPGYSRKGAQGMKPLHLPLEGQ